MKPRCELSAREVTTLRDALKRRLGDTSVPTLPEVAVRIVQLVSDPNASLTDFANIIRTDQALTGRLLRTSNSAVYAQRQPVTDLRRAMVLLGLERIKAMALGFHLSQTALKDEGSFSSGRIWTRSLFRAWLAFRIAEEFDKSQSGEAFIIGLMLDAGVPMMPVLLGELHEEHVSVDDAPRKQYAKENQNLPFTHVDIASALTELWRFPEPLSKPICLRYTEPSHVSKKQTAGLLHAVSYYVGGLELDCLAEGGEPENPMARVAERIFGLDTSTMKKLMRDAATDFKGSRELFKDVLDETLTVERILSSANRELSSVVEDYVEESIEQERQANARRFDAEGMILEIEPGADRKVVVYIADESGNRLLSEEFSPREKSPRELRQILMLEDASDDLFEQVSAHIRQIAA